MIAQFEQLRTNPTAFFNAFMLKQDEFDVPFHFHPEYELTLILSSSGTRFVGNHFEDFKENDMILLGPNVPHCWKNAPLQKTKASAIVIHWDEDFIDKKWLERQEFASVKKLLQLASNGVRFDASVSKRYKQKLKHLTALSSFERFHFFLKILHELSLCSEISVLSIHEKKYMLNYANNERISIALEHIRGNYAQKITLCEAAGKVKMTEETFSRFFSKTMRKSFFCYLNEYRINHACTQLIETDKSISSICYECGYDTQPFFFRQFKKFKNCSPGQYRKNYLKSVL